MDCFGHVSDALTTIYKDLTKSSKHPLGGQVRTPPSLPPSFLNLFSYN